MSKDLLTYSSLKTFRTCKRRYQFQYEMKRVPARESEALFFGSIIHDAIAEWLKSGRTLAVATSAILHKFETSPNPDLFMRAKCLALMAGYHARYKDELFTPVAVEKVFRGPLVNPATGRESNLFELGGKIDAIYEKDNRNILKETKTTSDDIGTDSRYWDKLALDSQISGYYLGAEILGFPIESCMYDVIKKPTISPYKATPTENRKYKKDGTLYANQREVDETVEEFSTRLREDISLQPDKYFARREVPRLQEDLEDYLFDVWEEAQVLHARRKAGKFQRNPDACQNNYGTCPYFDVCTKRASIEDPTLFKVSEEKHKELIA